jgi:hypothetical protein
LIGHEINNGGTGEGNGMNKRQRKKAFKKLIDGNHLSFKERREAERCVAKVFPIFWAMYLDAAKLMTEYARLMVKTADEIFLQLTLASAKTVEQIQRIADEVGYEAKPQD